MYISFSVLSALTLLLIFLIFKNKEYKNAYALYFLFVFIIFYSPALYFISGGTAYRYFENSTLTHYINFSSVIISLNLFFLFFKNKKFFPVINKKYVEKFSENKVNKLTFIYFGVIILTIIAYIGIYFMRFPLISLLFNGELLERPDVSGNIPHFYTFSTVMLFIVPAIFFYFYPMIKSVYFKILLTGLVFLLLIISGHKGIITFFAIFFWFTILERKINFKFVGIVVVLLVVYGITKGINFTDPGTIEYLATSPLRRFFVTQGVCMIYRFHALDINYIFEAAVPIKNQICNFMYNGDGMGCSSPTFFVGDLIIKYGIVAATSIYVASLAFSMWIIKNVDEYFSKNYFVKWSLFSIFFLMGMAELSFESILRIIAITLNVFIVFALSSYFNKTSLSNDNP
ncbi:MAG: hypothetical protein CVU05_12425 [Bacteroidetes bacterium HGW-Bacteroidetes-21]|jgi:hypothetical protein|nr:MAG: hypothetical protein CVU05_12425 [Bacteroidetes bacterium HGW-Bacteroidetes-21]